MSNGDAAPPALRTLRFGDRTISYDHEADDGAGRGSRVDDENVGGKSNSDVEPEDETEGRHGRQRQTQFDCAFSIWMLGLHHTTAACFAFQAEKNDPPTPPFTFRPLQTLLLCVRAHRDAGVFQFKDTTYMTG